MKTVVQSCVPVAVLGTPIRRAARPRPRTTSVRNIFARPSRWCYVAPKDVQTSHPSPAPVCVAKEGSWIVSRSPLDQGSTSRVRRHGLNDRSPATVTSDVSRRLHGTRHGVPP